MPTFQLHLMYRFLNFFPSEYYVYEIRLKEITQNVLQSKMTPAWVKYVAAYTENE